MSSPIRLNIKSILLYRYVTVRITPLVLATANPSASPSSTSQEVNLSSPPEQIHPAANQLFPFTTTKFNYRI